MTLGGVLETAMAATAAASALTAVWAARTGDAHARRQHARWAWALAGAAGTTYLFLAGRFLACGVATEHVFLYTRCDLPWQYRLAGAWTGREGSLLLWATWQALVAAAFAAWNRRAHGGRIGGGADAGLEHAAHPHARTADMASAVLAIIAAAFVGAVLWQDTFRATPAFLLEARPDGNGLNPLLRNPFILIHPPLMFLGYALTAVPAAAALGHTMAGGGWAHVSASWNRWAWLVLTAAIGLGGMWAYFTLGFGGYWAWDPVEVANLLPWLALTAAVHAALHQRRHGGFQAAGPLLGLLPFLLCLFSTWSTRSGLWVSVHAFTDPTNTFDSDPAARTLAILDAEPTLRFFAGLMLALLALGMGLWSRHLARQARALTRASAAVAAVLGALGGVAALDPRAALAATMEAGAALTGGRTGVGLLVLVAAAVLAASAPALVRDTSPAGPRRLDTRSLLYVAAVLLAIGLLVTFLFHMAAVRGWSEAFYLRRFPLLAAPLLVGILVLTGHRTYGTRLALAIAAGVLIAGLAAWAWRGPGPALAVMAASAGALAFDRVLRAALSPAPPRQRVGRSLLVGAAMLDVAFWFHPPSVLGVWRPVFPTQLVLGSAALLALLLALREAAGAHEGGRARALPFVWVGALGGYGVAPLLALAAWWMARPSDTARAGAPGPADGTTGAGGARLPPTSPAAVRQRLHQAATYGIHLAIAIALLGYAFSGYGRTQVEADLPVGQTLAVGDATLRLASIGLRTDAHAPVVAAFEPQVHVRLGGAAASGSAPLEWEPQAGSHFPWPATLRFWWADVYWSIESVCIQSSDARTGADWPEAPGATDGNGTTKAGDGPPSGTASPSVCPERVTAFAQGGRVPVDAEPVGARVIALHLPGMALVWTGYVLLLASMVLLLATERPAGPRRPPTGAGP